MIIAWTQGTGQQQPLYRGAALWTWAAGDGGEVDLTSGAIPGCRLVAQPDVTRLRAQPEVTRLVAVGAPAGRVH